MRKRFIGLAVGSVVAAGLFLVPAADAATPGGQSGQGVTAKAAANDCLGFAASSPQTRVVTDDFARTVASTAFTTLPCGTTSVSIPRGRTALIVAHVDAEVSCLGPVNQWCIGRILIGGVEGEPNAPEPDSFAWATARANLEQWEANGFTRTRRVSCSRASRTATCVVSVVTQVRNHASGMTMRIDDRTLHVQANF